MSRGLSICGLIVAGLLIIGGCAAPPTPALPATAATEDTTHIVGATPTWQSTPFPYTTPLPPLVATPLDGVYTKIDPTPGTPVPCRRCPDYLPAPGEWQLQFDRGIYRIYYTARNWRSVGSFTVDGDRLTIFNDPTCHEQVGTYRWKLDGDRLTLRAIDDSCAIDLRALNLTTQPWTRAKS
jgi:hypothetical protein